MLIRQAFITNSSSTSFIAYGILLELDDLFPELVDEGDLDWKDRMEKSDEYYERLFGMENESIGIHAGDCWENFPNGQVFVGAVDSWEDFGDGGGFIPINPRRLSQSDMKQWDKLLSLFCEKYKVKADPQWIFAANVAR